MAITKKTRGFNIGSLPKEFFLSKRKIPLRIANTAQRHFLEGFRRGGGSTNTSAGGWAPRKTSRSTRERKRSVGRAILVRSGKLRADIKKRKISFAKISVGTRSIPYADFTNEGTPRMKQREFIGDSRVLERKIDSIIRKEMNKIFKV